MDKAMLKNRDRSGMKLMGVETGGNTTMRWRCTLRWNERSRRRCHVICCLPVISSAYFTWTLGLPRQKELEK
jgi:hypothetical protein